MAKNALFSIVAMKCPRCRVGDQFRTPFSKLKIYDMHEHCPHCGLKYEQEPGFWWGAMYIGYALSSGALLITGLLCLAVFRLPLWQTYLIILVVFLFGFLYNARLSRSIWLHLYNDYEPDRK
jgi:uncharacterized protein (DUF983 family)